MTFDLDLINKWGFPCCIYDPSLVVIHQSMWKIEPNVNPFSQQKTDNNYSGQSDPYVFPAKAGNTKMNGIKLWHNLARCLRFAQVNFATLPNYAPDQVTNYCGCWTHNFILLHLKFANDVKYTFTLFYVTL